MQIVMAASEAVPFAKTGGLADVSSALPRELSKLGIDTTLILPCYRQVTATGLPIESTGVNLDIPIGAKTVSGRLLRSRLPGCSVPVYLVDCPEYFDRPGIYGEKGKDYPDNCERFIFFSRAVLEAIRLLEIPVDLIHCNDWQTGLIPAYLKLEYAALPRFENVASLMTIHNLAYQGVFWHWDMLLTGLDWKYFNWQQMEFFGSLNLLKTGLVFADRLSTVSAQYAKEIQTPELGCGLEGVLESRHDLLSGILNGIDPTEWNPATDSHIAQTYDLQTWREGKAACKAALQREMGLPVDAKTPLIGFVGRLAEQKGIDIITKGLSEWLGSRHVQWAFLGTGDPAYHDLLTALAKKYPEKLAVKLTFSDALAHQIEAGSDLFLMPSRYEPCGLNQMYSLRYGTVPIVRHTGGLADTIVDAVNGFSFLEYSTTALGEAVNRSLAAFGQTSVWEKLVTTGLQQDWSWKRSAEDYVNLYKRTIAQVRHTALV
jgi:starch synthase